MRKRPSGARPRLVCSTTPVALMTRRSEGAFQLRRAPRSTRASIASSVGCAGQNLRARVVDGAADFVDHQRARKSRERGAKLFEHLMDGRQVRGVSGVSLTNSMVRACAVSGATDYTRKFGAWLSLVERLVRDQEAGGSNPLAPTNPFSPIRQSLKKIWR